MRGAASDTWARAAWRSSAPADGDAGRGHVGSRRLPSDLRSASAGVGRSQKVILRARIGSVNITGQGWRPAHKGPSAQSSQGPADPGWGWWGMHGSATRVNRSAPAVVPVPDKSPTPLVSGPRRAGRLERRTSKSLPETMRQPAARCRPPAGTPPTTAARKALSYGRPPRGLLQHLAARSRPLACLGRPDG
jgi:hypothetical protein